MGLNKQVILLLQFWQPINILKALCFGECVQDI